MSVEVVDGRLVLGGVAHPIEPGHLLEHTGSLPSRPTRPEPALVAAGGIVRPAVAGGPADPLTAAAGDPDPQDAGALLFADAPAGYVWLTDAAWTVELTADHVRAEGTSGQRLEWDRWQILVYRITVDNGVCRLEPLVM